MIFVEVFVVLSLYIYILFRMPELRIAGSIIAFVLIGGLGFYMFTVPPEPQVESNRITIEEITLEALTLTLDPRTASLKGRAINGSAKYTLTGIEIDVKLYDCPDEEVAFTECFTIGEDDGYARLTAPPGQLRDFTATFLFNNLPEVMGVLRWEHTITGTRALDTTNR